MLYKKHQKKPLCCDLSFGEKCSALKSPKVYQKYAKKKAIKGRENTLESAFFTSELPSIEVFTRCALPRNFELLISSEAPDKKGKWVCGCMSLSQLRSWNDFGFLWA